MEEEGQLLYVRARSWPPLTLLPAPPANHHVRARKAEMIWRSRRAAGNSSDAVDPCLMLAAPSPLSAWPYSPYLHRLGCFGSLGRSARSLCRSAPLSSPLPLSLFRSPLSPSSLSFFWPPAGFPSRRPSVTQSTKSYSHKMGAGGCCTTGRREKGEREKGWVDARFLY